MSERGKRAEAGKGRGSGGVDLIDGRFEVDLEAPAAALNAPHAAAFEARDRENARASIYGLIVEPGIAWRGAAALAQMPLRHPSLLQLFALGPVASPVSNQRAACFILERPRGVRLSGRTAPLGEHTIRRIVLPGLIDGLSALHGVGVTHRAIRPTNLFYTSERADAIALGECVSAPPGFDQPTRFEPIERAPASLEGRGEGTPACDLFALGATIAALLEPPVTEPMDELDRMMARMERGAFEVLAGHLTCGGALRELLAGLLADDPARRWSLDDVRTWLVNPRANAPSVVRPRDGTRPYSVQGRSATQARAIAHLLAQNVDAARQDLLKGQLVRWLRSSLGEHDLADAIEKEIGRADELARGRRSIDEEQVARVCCLLDPAGPVRFHGLALALDGFGRALAQAQLAENADAVKTITQMISLGLPACALRAPNVPAAVKALEPLHQTLRGLLRSKQAGDGIERCLYEQDPGLPCLSPIVRSALPIGPHRFLAGLDHYADGVHVFTNRPLDRHGLAYVGARLAADQQKKARAISFKVSRGPSEAIGDLAMLALLQQEASAGAVPNLARWLAERVTPAFDGVRNKARRARLIRALKHKAAEGSLVGVLDALLDPREFRADDEEFRAAVNRYHALGQQIEALAYTHARRAIVAGQLGRRIAAGLGAAIFVGTCLISLFSRGS
jgi:hypothetical protein